MEITYFQGFANSFTKYHKPKKTEPTTFVCKASPFPASKNSYFLNSSPLKAQRMETQTHCRQTAQFPLQHRNWMKTFVKGGKDGDERTLCLLIGAWFTQNSKQDFEGDQNMSSQEVPWNWRQNYFELRALKKKNSGCKKDTLNIPLFFLKTGDKTPRWNPHMEDVFPKPEGK